MSWYAQQLRMVAEWWQVLSVLILLAITILSLTPLPALPEVPGSDKTHHLVAYGALMFPAALALSQYRYWIAFFFLLWSGGVELIQPFVNRYGEWGDLLANGCGIVLGFALGIWLNRLIFSKKLLN